jgi:hypothetical protein
MSKDASAALLAFILSLTASLSQLAQEVADQNKALEQFVSGLVIDLRKKFNDKNILVVDDDREYDRLLEGDTIGKAFCELKNRRVGYDVHVFGSGTFKLHGDWATHLVGLAGNFRRNGNTVEFFKSARKLEISQNL